MPICFSTGLRYLSDVLPLAPRPRITRSAATAIPLASLASLGTGGNSPMTADPAPASAGIGSLCRTEQTDDHTHDDGARGRGPDPGRCGQLWPAMVDPRRLGDRSADGHSRQHHRQHRPPHRSARSALFQRRSAVDRHRVLPCLRQPAPPRRAHRGHGRTQAGPHHRTRRLRGGIGHRRGLGQLRHAGHRPHRPGRVRCPARPLGARPLDHHLHESGGAWAGLRDLRGHCRRGRRAGTPARRHLDLVRLMALDALRQPRVRGHRHHRRLVVARARRGR